MEYEEIIKKKIGEIASDIADFDFSEPNVDYIDNVDFGDLSTNFALVNYSKVNKKFANPREFALQILAKIEADPEIKQYFEKAAVDGPGFINFKFSTGYLQKQIGQIIAKGENYGLSNLGKGKKILVEFAHPNTHKQMHIGHLRTLLIGESLSRILQSTGNEVFRANYQGDIGPHVAKAIYGVLNLLKQKNLTLGDVDKKLPFEKAKFLQEAYILGNQDYEGHKEEIDELNRNLYNVINSHPELVCPELIERVSGSNDEGSRNEFGMTDQNEVNSYLQEAYQITRKWSLEYFDSVYKYFNVKFDRLFFETQTADCGKKIVEENIGKVFKRDNGAVIFEGEKFGLHSRVFITSQGHPTYEAKDMCLAKVQYETFPFDKIIHVVASEQAEYFKVIIKALELINPKFKGEQYHLSMGLVKLADGKVSSRTGEIIAIEDLISIVKGEVEKLVGEGRIKQDERQDSINKITKAAIVYSYLKVNPTMNLVFDIAKSISLDGNSGPYILYTYARIKSVLAKANFQFPSAGWRTNFQFHEEDLKLARRLFRFPDKIQKAGKEYSPNIIAEHIYDLAKEFNAYYQKVSILKAETTELVSLRLSLISQVSNILKKGLELLDIEIVDRM